MTRAEIIAAIERTLDFPQHAKFLSVPVDVDVLRGAVAELKDGASREARMNRILTRESLAADCETAKATGLLCADCEALVMEMYPDPFPVAGSATE